MVPSKRNTFYSFKKDPQLLIKQKQQMVPSKRYSNRRFTMLPRNAQHPVLKQFPRKGSLETLQIAKPIIARYSNNSPNRTLSEKAPRKILKLFTNKNHILYTLPNTSTSKNPIRNISSKHHHETSSRNTPKK